MLYRYVGSCGIARCGSDVRGTPVTAPADAAKWITSAGGSRTPAEVTVTFVVTAEGALLVADRHSEHVACAGGRPVRAAGELCLALEGGRVTVTRVSNQSTGYCPEPETWAVVAAALRAAGLEPPDGFDPRCEFRRCEACGALNLVKCGVFECAGCGADLPCEYNAQTAAE
ncbi:MAG: hypothetical protein J0I06_13395 [Planctomycetes bacterium]|nr:hypothetical protein [Planctomycetota bacterium]